jgi:hypothetical protein
MPFHKPHNSDLCQATIDKEFDTVDVAALIGCAKGNSLGDLIGIT